MLHLANNIPVYTLLGALILGVGVFLELGRRLGLRHLKNDPDGALTGTGPIEGAIFGLLGLIVAFTFSGAAERFDMRKHHIIEEANAIGTAYLRVDLLPSAAQPPVREAFRKYVEARLDTYRSLPDLKAVAAKIELSQQLQKEIWHRSVVASREGNYTPAAMLLLPALNEMIDITTTRTVSAQIHPPPVIYILLVALSIFSAVVAGYSTACSKQRKWIHALSFLAVISVCVYVILDMEYPRRGLIKVDQFDQVLIDVRQGMEDSEK